MSEHQEKTSLLSGARVISPDDCSSIQSRSVPTGGKMTAFLFFAIVTAAFGSLQFGYNTGVINTPRDDISNCTLSGAPSLSANGTSFEDMFPSKICMSNTEWGIVVGAFPLGGLFGGLFGGKIADRVGRRWALAIDNLFFLAAALLMGLAPNIYTLVAGRLVVGVGSGMATVVVPLFLGEVSPANLRGAVGTVNQLFTTIGIFVAQGIAIPLGGHPGWRILLGLTAAPSVLQLLALPFITETPRWLAGRGEVEKARAVLARLRGHEDVQAELDEMVQGITGVPAGAAPVNQSAKGYNALDESENGVPHDPSTVSAMSAILAAQAPVSIWQLFGSRHLRRALIIAYVLQLSQQFSGINAVFYYSTDTFFRPIVGDSAGFLSFGVSGFNILMTLVAVYLMDRAGRRSLLLWGSASMALCSVVLIPSFVLDISILSSVFVFLYVASFAIALGPIPWLIMAEIFPTSAVGSAASVGVAINWLSNFIVSLVFPLLADAIGKYIFAPFAAILVAVTIFVWTTVPETKGRSIDEVVRSLQS